MILVFDGWLKCRSTPDKEAGATEALSGTEAIEGFIVGLYSEVFQAVVSLINRYFKNYFAIFCWFRLRNISTTYFGVDVIIFISVDV